MVDQKDETAAGETTSDAEAAAAIETTDVAISDLPVLKSEDLAPEWQADTPVLCVAGRGPVDEAAAIMLAQLLEKHGLRARVVSADAIAISNISRLEMSGIVMVCLSYLDTGSPAHMRYAIRRLRRKLPQAQSFLDAGWRMLIEKHFAITRKPIPSLPRSRMPYGSVLMQPVIREISVHRLRNGLWLRHNNNVLRVPEAPNYSSEARTNHSEER